MIILILLCVFPTYGQTKTKLPSIEWILKQPEDSINIGIACLSLAQEFYPDMNAGFFLYAFDYMADRFNHYFGHIKDPEQKLRALNSFLYQKGFWNDSITFSYNHDDIQGFKRENHFINGYLAQKKGTCVTMPMLYLILAERLDMPIKAVRAPCHFFLRYLPDSVDADWRANVEATSGGGFASDDDYINDMQITDQGIESGMYLRTLTKKEYLASILLLNSAEYMELKNFNQAQHYTEVAMKYDSSLATAYWAYGLVFYKRAWDLKEKMDDEIQTEIGYSEIVSHTRNRMAQSPELQTSANSKTKTEMNFDNEFKKYFIGLVPEAKSTGKQNPFPIPSDFQPAQRGMSVELYSEIDFIKEQYLPKIEKNLKVWYTYKQKAKDMGMVFGSQNDFFKKQTKKLDQFALKGVK